MLRRRDQTVRSLRVEHYSSAVNSLSHKATCACLIVYTLKPLV